MARQSQSNSLEDARNFGTTLARQGYTPVESWQISDDLLEDNRGASEDQLSQVFQVAEQAAVVQNQGE